MTSQDYTHSLEKKCARLVRENDQLREDHGHACEMIAKIHEAAMGEVCGPVRGVIEDVEDLRADRDNWKAQYDALRTVGVRISPQEAQRDAFEKCAKLAEAEGGIIGRSLADDIRKLAEGDCK